MTAGRTEPAGGGPVDPVLVRRERVARAVRIGQRVGYALFGLATVVFLAGFAIGFTSVIVTVIEVALIGGSAVLAPSIVGSFAVRAADRADREGGWR